MENLLNILKIISFVLVFISLISCGDSPIERNSELNERNMTIIDSETEKPLEGYTLEMYYIVHVNSKTEISEKFNVFPTPFFGTTSFKFVLDFQSNVEIKIHDLSTSKNYMLLNKYLPAGNYIYDFNFQDSSHYSGGLYKAYLKINELHKDSTTFLYTGSKDTLYLSINRDLFYINSYLTDVQGKIEYTKQRLNLVGQNVNIVTCNGSFIGSYKITEEVKCVVYNKEMQMVKTFFSTVEKLKKSGAVVKI